MNNMEMAKRMAAELFFGIRGDGEWERATRLQLKYRRPDGSEASGGGRCCGCAGSRGGGAMNPLSSVIRYAALAAQLAAVAFLLWRTPWLVLTLAGWSVAECAVDAWAGRPLALRDRLRNAAITAGPLLVSIVSAGAAAWLVHYVVASLGGPPVQWDAGAVVSAWPWTAVHLALLPLLISDGVYYVYHRIQHQWPILWRFHAVHHAPHNFNATVTHRQPWTESITQPLFLAVPLALINVTVPQVLVVAFIQAHWSYFIHTSIRLPMGPFSRVLAGPQYHRVHHARAIVDRNFSAFFPLWDILGRTHHAPTDWPDTGVDGVDEADTLAVVVGHSPQLSRIPG
jgi:sterol desaturase/sphingolipid hydroxylase (fatty acid hydroxylase superfamily)